MSEVTRILNEADGAGLHLAEELLPHVYGELRKVAAGKMAREASDHTLQATALVHEAYLRLTGNEQQRWANSRHFFAAAAESMRRILVERARSRGRLKRGGHLERIDINHVTVATEEDSPTLLFVHEALEEFSNVDPDSAELVKLRFFAGISNRQAAQMLGMSERTAKRNWAYARAWLGRKLQREGRDIPPDPV